MFTFQAVAITFQTVALTFQTSPSSFSRKFYKFSTFAWNSQFSFPETGLKYNDFIGAIGKKLFKIIRFNCAWLSRTIGVAEFESGARFSKFKIADPTRRKNLSRILWNHFYHVSNIFRTFDRHIRSAIFNFENLAWDLNSVAPKTYNNKLIWFSKNFYFL